MFADPLSEYFSFKTLFHSDIAVWSTSSVKKPNPHPRISASAINDLFPRVQRGKVLAHSFSYTFTGAAVGHVHRGNNLL